MQVTLPPKLEAFVKERIEAGEYESESAVLGDAVRLMQAHLEVRRQKLDRLREELAKGEADLANGRCVTFANDDELEAFFARL